MEDLNKELEESDSDQSEIRIKDDEELAEIIAISKKMLRKKSRRRIIEDSYNKYNYPENPEDLPKWFYEEERKHIGKIPGVTKEEVEREKETLKILKARLPKKVMEAKMRQKKKAMNKLMKAHTKATEIFDSENTPFSKARQINDLYKRATKVKEKKKEIIVARRHLLSAPNKTKGRKF